MPVLPPEEPVVRQGGSAISELVHVLALVGSGTVAGVLFGVALSVVPALAAMPPEQYVRVHTLLGRNWDPTMPAIVLGTTALEVGLAVTAGTAADRVLSATAAGCLLGVSVVSHFRNVPINRVVHRTDPALIGPGWPDPRPRWRRWHLLRTALAVLALLLTAAAAVR